MKKYDKNSPTNFPQWSRADCATVFFMLVAIVFLVCDIAWVVWIR